MLARSIATIASSNQFEQIMKATAERGVDVIVGLLANVNLGAESSAPALPA